MTTATEFQTKVDKASINMDRIDLLVNGSPTADVTLDGGVKVPSFAKLQGQGAVAVSGAQVAAAEAAESAAEAAEASKKVASVPGGPEFVLTGDDDSIFLRITPTVIQHPQIDALQAAIGGGSGGEGGSTVAEAVSRRRARMVDRTDARWDGLRVRSRLLQSAIMGQSLGSGVSAFPLHSTAPVPGGYMFPLGVRYSTDGAFDVPPLSEPLLPLQERIYSNKGETIASGSTRMLAQVLAEENGVDFAASGHMMLWTCSAVPGQPIDVLDGPDVPGSPFAGAVDAFYFGRNNGVANALPYDPLNVDWIQGEGNQTVSTTPYYRDKLIAFQADFQASVQQKIGSTRDLPWLTYQTPTVPDRVADGTNRPTSSLGQLEACSTDLIAMASPAHFLPFASPTDIHLTAIGEFILGAYFGLAKKRWFWDGIKPRPITAKSVRADGRYLVVELDVPSGYPITIDRAVFPNLANGGVTVATAGGAPVPVSSVSILGGNLILVETGSARTAGDFFRHGWIGAGPFLQGAIRDTAGIDMVFDPEGVAHPMHHWLPICEKAAA